MTNILLVDNYDSFTYNIAHIVRSEPMTNLQIIEAGKVRTGELGRYQKIIFSPGPDLPRPGNIMEEILSQWGDSRSILGICLGMQAIWLFYGGRLKKLDRVVHGMSRTVIGTGIYSAVLKGLPGEFKAGFYHSWIADPDHVPGDLLITAVSEGNRIMAIRHRRFDIEAVQFHPESVMTPLGVMMIRNWMAEKVRPESQK